MMLGCGPIFLPGNFLGDGWLMSTLFLFIVGVLSYLTTMFVVESMGLCNAIIKKKKLMQSTVSDENGKYANNAYGINPSSNVRLIN